MDKQPAHRTQSRLIAQAAELLLKCAGFLDDSDAAVRRDDDHCETYYAIDADVITLYLEPELVARYLDVFADDPNSSTRRSLAFLLGDFLMNSSIPLLPGHEKHKCRFLLIPPHDEELIRTLSAIHRQLRSVATNLDSALFGTLSSLFDTYESNPDDDRLLRELRRCVPDLVELFNPYRGPKAALTRYALLPETTFDRIETYLEDEFTFPVFDPLHDNEDRQTADELIEHWLTRLRRRKVRHKPEYALNDDAEVLATLEYVNSNLRGSGKQVVLVTGSKYIFDAADEYVLDDDSSLTFSDRYLRHPQAFLAHPEFFALPSTTPQYSSPGAEIPFKLIDWLNLIFPTELRPSHQPYGVVRRTFLRHIRSAPDHSLSIVNAFLSRPNKGTHRIETLLERWNSVIASLAQARYAGGLEWAEERGAKELAKTLTTLRKRGDWSVDRLRDLLLKESLGSISGLYSTTVWFGLWSKVSQEQSKGVPALRFDDHVKELEDYCDAVVRLQLESANKSVLTSLDEKLEKLRDLNTRVVQSDPSLYDAHLVHALAFATKGHWYATLTLANTAMAICDQMDPATRGPRRGREAAYLACIAARRSVKSRQGLDEARKYLNEAIERENKGAPRDIRFLAEDLALDTRSHYFDHFCDHMEPKIDAVMGTLTSLHDLVKTAEKEKNDRVKHWVLRQTLTNFFTLLLMVRNLKDSNEVFRVEDINRDLDIFQAILADVDVFGYKPEDDPYAQLVCAISTVVWDTDSGKRKKAKIAVVHAVSQYDADFMPYDRERRDFLVRSIPGEGA